MTVLDSVLRRRPEARDATRLDDALFVACGLSWGAALVHVQATVWHVNEYAPFAAFFALLASAQVAWGIAVYRRPTRRLMRVGVMMSLAVVMLWIVSRTSGVPIGPNGWSPEPIGAADTIATADEAALALLAALQLWPRNSGNLRAGAVAAGIALISLSSLTFMMHGH